MATAVHLSINSSEITVASNLNKAYSNEGVPTLNVASEVEFPKSLWSTLQSHEVQEAKMADFWAFSCTACSLTGDSASSVKTVTSTTAHPKMVARAKPLHRHTEINSFQQFLISHFCFLYRCGTVAYTRETSEIQLRWPRLE